MPLFHEVITHHVYLPMYMLTLQAYTSYRLNVVYTNAKIPTYMFYKVCHATLKRQTV